jgi:TPR repeat protein
MRHLLRNLAWCLLAASLTPLAAQAPSDLSLLPLATVQQRAAAGDSAAQARLGNLYHNGIELPHDDAQAAAWYRKAADQGNAIAQTSLGDQYYYGQGVPQDYDQSLAWYRKAADQGSIEGQADVGYMYQAGLGVPQDYVEAAKWNRKAAEQGSALAQNALGVMYNGAHGVDRDYAQAAAWFRKSAGQGYPTAQDNLGDLYFYGHGVPKDYAESLAWYRKAADQGVARGQLNVGYMYGHGLGVPRDNKEGCSWYRKAADQGMAEAQYDLGLCYEGGDGVPRDFARARQWLQKAAAQSYKFAQDELAFLDSAFPDPASHLAQAAVNQSAGDGPQRGLAPDAVTAQAAAPAVGKFYALVIGINQYPKPMPQLVTAAGDAQAIAALLQKRYGFQTSLLLNAQATRANILDAINHYRLSLKEGDNLLIYYAGHGYLDPEADKAYWLPVDADSTWSPNRISADDLTSGVKVQPARHVLIISDSCYSGGLSRDASLVPQSTDQDKFFTRMLNGQSRTLMASGGDEPVSDAGTGGHSVFAYAVLTALGTADHDMFTASDLFYNSVRVQVAGQSDQVPHYDVIRNSNHRDGDFVFVRAPSVTTAAQ